MEDDEREIAREERAIYWIIAIAVSPVVVGMVLEGDVMDGGGTLSLLLVLLAIAGIVAGIRAFTSARLPRARVYKR